MLAKPELLQKLDALLNKHRRPAGHDAENDDNIPLLTDIVETPPLVAAPAVPTVPAPPTAASVPLAVNATPNSELSDAEVEILTRDIFQHVMSELDSRISSDLHVHLAERLSLIIDNAVGAAISDFKQELADIVSAAIAGALLDRIERIAAAQTANRTDNTGN